MHKTHSIATRTALFLMTVLLVTLTIAGWLQYMEKRQHTISTAYLYGNAVFGSLVKSIQLTGLGAIPGT